MSSLKCFPCRVCLLVISLIYHHSMERSTFTVTMNPFFFYKLQWSLDNLNASISIHLWAIEGFCQVIVALKSEVWTELYSTVRENDLSNNISKCPICLFTIKEDPALSHRILSFRRSILILLGVCFSHPIANQHPLLHVKEVCFSIVSSCYPFH